MNSAADVRYSAWAATGELRLRRWGDELAVFDECSAQTHVLKEVCADLLTVLWSRREVLTLDELADRLFADDAGQLDVLDSDERAELERLLEVLLGLGLVRRTG